MHAADDSSTLLPPSAGIERNAADKAESAARAAASRVTAWLQRSPTGPLARASCTDPAPDPGPDPAPGLARKATDETSGDKPGDPAKDEEASAAAEDNAASAETAAPAPLALK